MIEQLFGGSRGYWILAHGISGRSDLPISPTLAQWSAVVVLLLTFVLLSVRWKAARFHEVSNVDATGSASKAPAPRTIARGIALAFWIAMPALALFGSIDSSTNPAPTWLYVWLWVGLVPLSLLFGALWRAVNPLRTLAMGAQWLVRSLGFEQRSMPRAFGCWPGVLSLLTFLWLELVKTDQDQPKTVGWYVIAYSIAHVVGGTVYGQQWFARAEGFELYSTALGHLSPVYRDSDGWAFRNPLRQLTHFPNDMSLVGLVCVLLGSTAFDGFTRSQTWGRIALDSSPTQREIIGTLALVGAIALVFVSYALACAISARLAGDGGLSTRVIMQAFAHSLIPVAAGYAIAHYFSLLIFQGQAGVYLMGDPLGTGANYLGLTDQSIDYSLISSSSIAVIQVLAIVVGHLLGAISAHDQALSPVKAQSGNSRSGDAPSGKRAQLPLLVLMVTYTFVGIGLLLSA